MVRGTNCTSATPLAEPGSSVLALVLALVLSRLACGVRI
jgi:hypothetical protein